MDTLLSLKSPASPLHLPPHFFTYESPETTATSQRSTEACKKDVCHNPVASLFFATLRNNEKVDHFERLKEVPGVFSQGESLEELEENIRDAYCLMVEGEISHRTMAQTKEIGIVSAD